MNCNDIDAILDEHRARTLGPAQRAAVDLHVAGCERCADAWLVDETLSGETPEPPRAGLFAESIARAPHGAARAALGPRQGAGGWLGLAAAALVAAVALVSFLPPEGGERGVAARPPLDLASPPALPERASRFVAGQHYVRLDAPAPTAAAAGRVEVCEFFMFGCWHCYALESELEAWAAARPDYVDFVRVPALFNATARLHAQAFYTADALAKADELSGPFYEEIHVRGNPLDTAGALEEFFGRFGVEAGAFRAAFNSVGVYRALERAEALSRAYGVNAAPSLGVNGRFLTDPSMAGSAEALFQIVDELVEVEASASCHEGASPSCPLDERRAAGRD